jgi:PAS domain S-box-containing protein
VDRKGKLRAVIGIDIPLQFVFQELLEERDSGQIRQAGEALFAFLVDGQGRLIAFPQFFFRLFGIAVTLERFRNASQTLDMNLAESGLDAVQSIVPDILQPGGKTMQVTLVGGDYFLTTETMAGTGWHLVMVTAASAYGAGLEETGRAFSGTIDDLIGRFAVSAVVIGLILVVAVFLFVRYFVSPILRMAEASAGVGQGDLTIRCNLDRHDELGVLADSFDDMVERLAEAEWIRKDYARNLELTVVERTNDLRQKNIELRQMVLLLQAERDQREIVTKELEKSGEQFRTAMEASMAGLCIIQDFIFRYVNPALVNVLGYSSEELTDRKGPLDLIVKHDLADLRQRIEARTSGIPGKPYQIRCIRKDGREFEALVGGAPIVWMGRPAVIGNLIDISDQKQVEEQLRTRELQLHKSLAEKEVLLREVYHRTKNNMLVIIAMLNLRAMETDIEKVREVFRDTENRIRAMSLVHERLYQSQNLSELDFGVYLREMTTTLVQNMILDNRVKVEMDCPPLTVSIDTAVPLGLAVNEIVTNSLKHAFPDGRSGTVFIGMKAINGGIIELQIGDDGIGLPAEKDIHTSVSFGMQITVNLVLKQLKGTLAVTREGGTRYILRFSEPQRIRRIQDL